MALILFKRLTTTPYNPQSNVAVGNFNRTLAAHAYRITVNSATGYSSFRVLYGRETRTPSESWIQDFSTTHDIPISKYVEELQLKAVVFSHINRFQSIQDRVSFAPAISF